VKPDVLSKFGNSIRTKLSDYYGLPFRPASQDLRDQLIFELVEIVQQARQEIAREIFEEMEKLLPSLFKHSQESVGYDANHKVVLIHADWCPACKLESLISKYLQEKS
jgi:hypothetical protein